MKFPFRRLIFIGVVALSISILLAVNCTHFSFQNQRLHLSTGVAFAQTAAKPPLSEQAFKNIQVLKGIPVDEFMGTMGLFSAALSVCCGDCHTGAGTSDPKWDDDAPAKKKVARRMVTMVNNINKENFGGRNVITCWTCHRGAESPAQTPQIDAIYSSSPNFVYPDVLPTAPPATSGTPPVDQIIDKYIQALGGADTLAKLTSYRLKGSSLLFGAAGGDPAEILAKAPGNIALEVHQKEGEMARTFNGREGWVVLPLTVVKEYPLHDAAYEGAKLVGEMAFPGKMKSYLTNWKVSYPATIDGKDVYVIQGSGPSGMLANFYFDKQTGLLNRMVYYATSVMGRVPTQIDYSDYRAVAGVKLPFKWTYGWVSGQEQYAFTDAQPNVTIADSAFAKPASAQK